MTERRSFLAAFGVIFPVSDTMTQKCWRALEHVPAAERDILATALLAAAEATTAARTAARNEIARGIGVPLR